MTDIIQTLRTSSSGTLRWTETHALKLGPFPFAVKLNVRAFSDHHLGGPASTAWMKLFYERDLVDEASRTGDPIPLELFCNIHLAAGNGASLRLQTGNQGSTVKDYGFEVTFTLA